MQRSRTATIFFFFGESRSGWVFLAQSGSFVCFNSAFLSGHAGCEAREFLSIPSSECISTYQMLPCPFLSDWSTSFATGSHLVLFTGSSTAISLPRVLGCRCPDKRWIEKSSVGQRTSSGRCLRLVAQTSAYYAFSGWQRFNFLSLQEVYPLIVSGVQLSTVNAKDEDSLQQEPRFFSISTPQQHFCEDRAALSEVPTGQWSLEGAICTNWGGLKLRADPGSLTTFDPNISTRPLGLVTPNFGLARLPALRYPFETTYHLIAPRLYI